MYMCMSCNMHMHMSHETCPMKLYRMRNLGETSRSTLGEFFLKDFFPPGHHVLPCPAKCHVLPCPTMSYHVLPCPTMSFYHVLPCMSYRVLPHVLPCPNMSFWGKSRGRFLGEKKSETPPKICFCIIRVHTPELPSPTLLVLRPTSDHRRTPHSPPFPPNRLSA